MQLYIKLTKICRYNKVKDRKMLFGRDGFKKKKGKETCMDRGKPHKQKSVDFELKTRENQSFENLSQKNSHILLNKYDYDHWEAYDLIDPRKRLICKAHN